MAYVAAHATNDKLAYLSVPLNSPPSARLEDSTSTHTLRPVRAWVLFNIPTRFLIMSLSARLDLINEWETVWNEKRSVFGMVTDRQTTSYFFFSFSPFFPTRRRRRQHEWVDEWHSSWVVSERSGRKEKFHFLFFSSTQNCEFSSFSHSFLSSCEYFYHRRHLT